MSNSCIVNLYESLNALQRKARPAGTFSQALLLKSNSLLNTIKIDANTGTVTVRLLETFNDGVQLFDQRVFSAGATGVFQWKSNCFHNKAKVEIITDTATTFSYFVMARSGGDQQPASVVPVEEYYRERGSVAVDVGNSQDLLTYVVPALKSLLLYSWHGTAQNPGNLTLDIDGTAERVSPIRAARPVVDEEFLPRIRVNTGQTLKIIFESRAFPSPIGTIYWDVGGSLVDS